MVINLGPSTDFPELSLQDIGRTDGLPGVFGELKVGQAILEVILQAGDCSSLFLVPFLGHSFGSFGGFIRAVSCRNNLKVLVFMAGESDDLAQLMYNTVLDEDVTKYPINANFVALAVIHN